MSRLTSIEIALIVLVASVVPAFAQGDEEGERRSRSSKALLSAFGGSDPIIADDRSLDDVASAVSATLSKVDRKQLGELRGKLDDLKSQEEALRRMLSELDDGLPVPVSVTSKLEATAEPVTPESLQSEKELLLGLQTKLARQEREAAARRAIAEKLEAAKKPTRSTKALLTALGELPEAPAAMPEAEVIPVASTPFPRKLAEALYRTGDYRGALRLYQRAAEEGTAQPKDYYRVARCHEWLSHHDKAVEALQKLLAAQPDESEFWHQRAKSYLEYLKKVPSVERALNK